MTPSTGISPAVKAISIFLVVLATACASTSNKTQTLQERVEGRWAALLANDFEAAYQYFTPGYRSSQSLRNFEISFMLRKVKYRSAEYIKEECQASACTVTVKLGYTIMAPVRGLSKFNGKSDVFEKWVFVNGAWFVLPDD